MSSRHRGCVAADTRARTRAGPGGPCFQQETALCSGCDRCDLDGIAEAPESGDEAVGLGGYGAAVEVSGAQILVYEIHTFLRLHPCLMAWNWVRPLSMTIGPGLP